MESSKLEQIVSQFLLKTLHIVLDSRIPAFSTTATATRSLSSVFHVRKTDKWFNLVLGDRPAAMDNLNFWHRNLMDPMVIDIILVQHQCPPSSSLHNNNNNNIYHNSTSTETVIERWVIQYESPLIRYHSPQSSEGAASYKKTYKKSIVLLRSLYSFMRLLPAHRIFRQLGSSTQSYDFNVIYKVSSLSDPFSRAQEEIMKEYAFAPVEAYPGRLCVSVTYRSTLSDFNLEPAVSFPTKIITDYVGSPATDPMRYVSSSVKDAFATSVPSRGFQPPLSERPHSWTSGFHANRPLGSSPLAHRTSTLPYDFPSPPGNQSYRPPAYQKATSYDDYQPTPPFSPCTSPSPPSYFFNSNNSETAPVTIPLQLTSRHSRHLSPNFSDHSRSSLPPLSPRSIKYDPSSQESPSGIRSYRKIETSRAADLHSGMTNPLSVHKLVRDGRDDSGRFSGLLSSSGSPRIGYSGSSSRLSVPDDLDDCDFSCPFDVDDVDPLDSPARHNFDGKKGLETAQSLPVGRKSQDAAVGVLVHMLRTAPPLRPDSSCYSSHSLKPEVEQGVATASGFFMARQTADALEELKSYREMKGLLLSKSGTRVISKDEA
ncbi:hypothetical protein ACFE04_010730 [Oxalis oulophora]